MEELLIRYGHFLGIIILSSMLMTQNVLITNKLDNRWYRKLAIIDGIYGLSAVVVLTTGLLLWWSVGKPSAFYAGNPLFHLKLGIFIVVALLSAIPTYFFVRNRNSTADVQIPKHVLVIKRIEIVLLLSLPLLAVFMARGIGYSG